MTFFEDGFKKNGLIWLRYIYYALVGCLIGAIVGLAETIFCLVLNGIFKIRVGLEMPLLLLMPFAGLLIVYIFVHYGGKSKEGMNLVFKVDQGKYSTITYLLVPCMAISTWLTHLVGGSVGREGVAVQIGATLSYRIGEKLPFSIPKSMLLETGIAAGFSGLFGTPIAAAFFGLEVLVSGAIRYEGLCSALTGSFMAAYISGLFGIHATQFVLPHVSITFFLMLRVIVLGIVCAFIGMFFSKSLQFMRNNLAKLWPNPYQRIFIMGILCAVLLATLYHGRYCGLGVNLIQAAMTGKTIYPWDWILKLVMTVLVLASGFQGGEVMPLFTIGTCLGYWIGTLLGIPPMFAAALGYAALFAAGTNTLLAPIAIGMEIFGTQYFMPFFIVCAIAFLLNKNHSIYVLQRNLRI
ncbi:MAG: chloride channel protein [Absicoccus sp.]|uniref:Chloride channel protein n=1 Tax=Absicoccus intestinalis TaxID=2926319 RepID=A0ABU4WP20_9FIRM|nr:MULTISPECIES: chloride channel protein [unclassified Absicoccus]MDX8418310.1 chloride channel protein [Absicoccus sp. CLA-KB-P134]MDY3035091.1 chloride channel protein [Absicoccus sp.]